MVSEASNGDNSHTWGLAQDSICTLLCVTLVGVTTRLSSAGTVGNMSSTVSQGGLPPASKVNVANHLAFAWGHLRSCLVSLPLSSISRSSHKSKGEKGGVTDHTSQCEETMELVAMF